MINPSLTLDSCVIAQQKEYNLKKKIVGNDAFVRFTESKNKIKVQLKQVKGRKAM